MAQMFLYTAAARLRPGDLKRLREAGIVPVKVESLEDVRLVDVQSFPVPANRLLADAVAALNVDWRRWPSPTRFSGTSCRPPARAAMPAEKLTPPPSLGAVSAAAGHWLTEHGLADRFSGVTLDEWLAFLAVVIDAHELARESAAIKEAEDVKAELERALGLGAGTTRDTRPLDGEESETTT